jgi:hypothetical protein
MAKFDPATLEQLRTAEEISIRSSQRPDTDVLIWVAVADGEVLVRSARGASGRWYRDLVAEPIAMVGVAGRSLAVRAVPAADRGSNERASREYLRKYRGSPYAQAVVRPELLSTILRLEPGQPDGE